MKKVLEPLDQVWFEMMKTGFLMKQNLFSNCLLTIQISVFMIELIYDVNKVFQEIVHKTIS